MAALFAFTGSQIMSNLLSVISMRVEVCQCGPLWSLTIEYVALRAWYIGCALGLHPREEISIISVRSKFSRMSPIGLASDRQSDQQSSILCIRSKFNARVAQVAERRSRKAEVGVSTTPSGSRFRMGESFNGRTAGLQPADGGSIPSSSTIFVRDAVARLRLL